MDLLVLGFHLAAVGERGPRASPGTGLWGGAHCAPMVKEGTTLGVRQGRGKPPAAKAEGRVVSGQGWGSQLYSWGFPLRLVMHRERAKGGAKTGGASRGSYRGGLRGPCCALGGRHCGWELTESAPGAGIVSCRGGGGGPSYALGGCHCGWESPFRVLLGPPGSASSGWSGGVRTTGKGTGTLWSREPRTAFSGLPNLAVAERPRLWGQGFCCFTPLWKAQSCVIFPTV